MVFEGVKEVDMAARVAVLFPGQGAQKVGMGRDLYEEYQFVRRIYEQANDVLGFDITRLCFEGPLEELTRTDRSQVAILVTSYAALEVARHKGLLENVEVAATCGLSLGEYTALVFANVLTFEDALRIVERRGVFMQQACDAQASGMVSVIGLDFATVERLVEETRENGVLVAANYNSPNQLAVSGDVEALSRFEEAAKRAGAKRVIRLRVAGAFHSPLMSPAARKLAPFINNTTFSKPQLPFLSNVTGDFCDDPHAIKENLKKQVDHPIKWAQSIQKILDTGVREFWEVGPGTVLSGLLRRGWTDYEIKTRNFCDVSSFTLSS